MHKETSSAKCDVHCSQVSMIAIAVGQQDVSSHDAAGVDSGTVDGPTRASGLVSQNINVARASRRAATSSLETMCLWVRLSCFYTRT